MVPLTKMAFSGENIKSQHNEYICEKCNKSFKKQDSLRRHKRIECGKEKLFKCPICPTKSYYFDYQLNNHVSKTHQNNDKIENPNKEKISDKNSEVVKELEKKNNALFLCKKCGKTFKLQDVLNKHQQKNKCRSLENIFKCPICDQRFHDEDFLNGHIQDDHKAKVKRQAKVSISSIKIEHKPIKNDHETVKKPVKTVIKDQEIFKLGDKTIKNDQGLVKKEQEKHIQFYKCKICKIDIHQKSEVVSHLGKCFLKASIFIMFVKKVM